MVLTSGENGYGIPELQAVLNKAIEAEFGTRTRNKDGIQRICLFYDEFNGEADYEALYAHIHAKSWKLTASTTASLPTLAAAPVS